jgi:hypothetical protein
MRTFVWLLPVTVLVLQTSTAAQQPGSTAARQKPMAMAQIPFTPVSTIKDLMDALVDPQSDVVFEAVATIISPGGTEERAPKTDDEWAAVRKGALMLIEGGNLLMMPGRHVAAEGARSDVPGIELEPTEIDALINGNRDMFVRRAQGLVNAAIVALRAIDAKNVRGLSDAAGALDVACENCHTDFWYPNQAEQLKRVEERQKTLFK